MSVGAILVIINWLFLENPGGVCEIGRKIRQLVSDLEAIGFRKVPGGKGSHRKFVHPKFRGFVLISGHDGDDARHYQEQQVRKALRLIQS